MKNLKRVFAIFLAFVLVGCSQPTTNNDKSVSKDVEVFEADVIVVGTGAAGLSASVQASVDGLKVIALEKNGFTGGSTNSAEGYGAINSNYAKEKGYNYDVREIYHAAQEFHHWQTDEALVWNTYIQSGDNANWLQEQGVNFATIAANGNNKYMTWHFYDGGESHEAVGTTFVNILTEKAKENGAEIHLNTTGKELIMEDGKIAGIKAVKDGKEVIYKAKVVILATGGYADNPEMLTKLAHMNGEEVADMGVAGRTGDGINMALEVGASTRRLKGTLAAYGPSMPMYSVYSPMNMVGWMPLLGVNRSGNRFGDESYILRDWGTAGAIQKQHGVSFKIVTESSLKDFEKNGFPTWMQQIEEFRETLEKELEANPEYIMKADTIEELAKKMGVDPVNLKQTVDHYNELVKSGKDTDFNKAPEFLFPVEEGPFYAFKFLTGIFNTTDGLEITTNAEVLNTEGKVIPGLYATGSDAGGLNGETYEVSIVPGAQQSHAVNSARNAARSAKIYLDK